MRAPPTRDPRRTVLDFHRYATGIQGRAPGRRGRDRFRHVEVRLSNYTLGSPYYMTPLAHIGALPVEALVRLLSVGVPALVASLRALTTTGERRSR